MELYVQPAPCRHLDLRTYGTILEVIFRCPQRVVKIERRRDVQYRRERTRRGSCRARAGDGCIRSIALFATAAEALASPHRSVWIDYRGGKAALPRHERVG